MPQYVVYLRYMGQYLRLCIQHILHGDFALPVYDFSIGMGDDIGQIVRFHPLDFLSVFVPSRYTETLYGLILLIRFYLGTDLIGSEIGAAAKNVIGIAAGILDGLHYTSLKGALMARGTREIARLIAALGGNEFSAYGLCHLGDYEATLFSPWSHNRKFGEDLVQGIRFEKLAEGVMTSKALFLLGQEYGVDMPIVESVYKVLFEGENVQERIKRLFERSVKKEF